MKCEKFRKDIVLHLYGELSAAEDAALRSHITECPDCAADLAYSKKIHTLIDEVGPAPVPEADWERNWARIDAGLTPSRRKRPRRAVVPGWAYAAAGVLIIFTIGLFTARFWSPFGRSTDLAPSPPRSSPLKPTVSP